ncbi:type I iodothyronine deiodinase-like isoform X3 [Panulirus ornatus]|uniref:type I iodothyronine deiodinase-like isoform X3 n=1 Tax=Panulirus ornatus TaxID=150431 RepID=UPI003A8946C4
MANLERFREMTEEHSLVADFLMVYIAEAHPTDGWALRDNIAIAKHRTLEERFTAAQMLEVESLKCRVVVDRLEDEASNAYGALPERLFIILDGVVVYKGEQGPTGYKLSEVDDWLTNKKLEMK